MSADLEPSDEEYETWLHIPQELVGYVVGKGARNLNHVMSETNTYIRTQKIGDKTYFVIEGEPDDRYSAKLKLKRCASICQSKNEGLSQSWFPCVDGKEGTYELQPCDYQGFQSKLVLKSPIKDYSGRDNYNLLLQELSKILQQNKEKNRSSNIWCHFGKIYINYLQEEREYSLSELDSHLMPKRLFAPEETKWRFKFFSGINQSSSKALDNLVSSKPQTYVPYKRKDITFCTPSCRELRLNVFMVVDNEHSSESETVYKNAKCSHEIHNVIKKSGSSPYFYICQSNNRVALVDIFEPSAKVDIRLITESNSESFSEEDVIYKEANTLYEYVKMNLRITEQGEVDLPSENCPPDFEARYNRTSYRDTRVFYSSEEVTITARLSMETHDSGNDLDIHLDIEGCSKMTPDEIIDKVPRFLSCARDLAREITISDENEELDTVPPEILARGPQAQSAYRYALKSGKVKNHRLPVVLVGQSRSGKTSLLRSLNGEKFNLSEDSTVGAKLQRSLSKVEDGDWEKNHIDESLLYNQCAAMELAKHLKLMKLVPTNTDDQDDTDRDLYDYDSNSLQNNQREYATEVDSAENNTSARSVEPRPLELQEDPEMVDDNATQNMDNVQTYDSNVYQHELPDEVAMHTAHILEHPEAEKKMKNHLFFHTMDFAGQPVYSVTHPVFLPSKGIYLLVHSLKNDLHAQATPIVKTGAVERKIEHDPMTNIDHLKFWLSLIDANSTQEGGSPVFVVSTHKDKPFEPDVEHTGIKILSTLTEEDFAPGRHVVHRICTVDNTISGSSSPEGADIKELKAQICKKAKSLPQMNEDIPVRWLLFEKKLEHLVRDEKRKHISFQEAESIALQCEVDVSSDELETLLNYLHDLKVIIHFPETGMIIIDTQWLLDMFAKVITIQTFECHEGHVNEWRKLEHQGIVDVKFLEHLWKDLLNDDTSVVSLIRIMEKFSLVCKQQDGSFLVPAMLSNSTMDALHELMKKDDCALVVRFKSSHLPLSLFPRLLVAVEEMCLNLKCNSSTPPHLSRNFARFYIHSDDDCELSLVFIADTATFAVLVLIDDVNPGRRDEVYVQQCKSILDFLRKTLNEMVTSFPWMKSLAEFDFCIRCPICVCSTSCKKHNKNDCYRDSCVHLVSEKELLKTSKPRCQKNPTKPNIIPDTSYSHWFPRSKCQYQEMKKDVTNNPEAVCSSSKEDKDNPCTDIVPLLNLMPPSIPMEKATEKAKEIAVIFNLDKNSVEDPPDDIRRRCRKFCKEMIARGQRNCVQALMNELPSGMTGPLQFEHDLLVKEMDFKTKDTISKALTVREKEWKTFAIEKVKLSVEDVNFLDVREKNPVLWILNQHCGDWSVDDLYTAIVDCGANADADRYL